MDESVAETLILAINALGAGVLVFIAGILQKTMDAMDTLEFKKFLNALDRTAMSNHFLVTIGTIPIIAAILYFMAYGFHHRWFTAGLIVWLIGSTITKITNMPVYNWVGDPKNNDPEELKKQRQKLRLGNNLRAWVTFASVVLMACQFGVREVVVIVVLSGVISIPLTKWARKYIPS